MNYLLNIAIDKYNDCSFTPLNNAVHDARKFEKILTENYDFEVYESLFDENASRKNIIESLNTLSSILIENDCLIIYFAGHGTLHTKTVKGFWIPQDATNAVSDFIPNSTIIDIISGMDAKHIALIIDSCFSGAFLTQTRSISNFHYTKLNENRSRWVLSSGRNEKVSDGQPGIGSPFSVILNEFLEKNSLRAFSFMELAIAVSKGTGSIAQQQPIFAHIEGVGHENGQIIFNLKNASIITEVEDSALLEIVISYESAIKLKELGFPQSSIFGYYKGKNSVIVKRSDTLVNLICSAYTYEEVVSFIPEEIEVDENTYLARMDGYDKLELREDGDYETANVVFQRTFIKDTPFMAICECKKRMVAFSMTEDGYYNNLICWGKNQAESASLMILELLREKKIDITKLPITSGLASCGVSAR